MMIKMIGDWLSARRTGFFAFVLVMDIFGSRTKSLQGRGMINEHLLCCGFNYSFFRDIFLNGSSKSIGVVRYFKIKNICLDN